jgi:hypothetical protein
MLAGRSDLHLADVGTAIVGERSAASRPIGGLPGRADLQRPGVRCSRCPVHPGVRTDTPPVSAALPPRVSAPRWTWSGSAWRAAPAGRSGSTCPRGLWAAWSPAGIGPHGKRWRGGCRCLLAGGSTVARAAAWPASRLRRRLGPGGPTGALVQGQGAGRVAGSMGPSRCSPAPVGRPGQVAGVVPGHGPGPGGGDHAGWSLG